MQVVERGECAELLLEQLSLNSSLILRRFRMRDFWPLLVTAAARGARLVAIF